MIKVGDICPLVFEPLKDGFLVESNYIQKFHTTDTILVQIFATGGETVSARLNNLVTGASSTITLSSYTVNDTMKMYYFKLTGINESTYTVTVASLTSEPFCVSSSDSLLSDTSLIRCSNKDNNSAFDNIFWIGDSRQFIEFRVEAGFRPHGIDQRIENETFRDQFQSLVQLYAVPYETRTLYVGNASGVPYWVAKTLNRMLCVSYFTINGEGYIRSEDSVPEKTQIGEDRQSFWFSILIETAENDIAGIGGESKAADITGTIAFSLNNLQDGDILRYDEDNNVFENTSTVD